MFEGMLEVTPQAFSCLVWLVFVLNDKQVEDVSIDFDLSIFKW